MLIGLSRRLTPQAIAVAVGQLLIGGWGEPGGVDDQNRGAVGGSVSEELGAVHYSELGERVGVHRRLPHAIGVGERCRRGSGWGARRSRGSDRACRAPRQPEAAHRLRGFATQLVRDHRHVAGQELKERVEPSACAP